MAVFKEDKNIGFISQIIGPVLDITFSINKVPKINNALIIDNQKDKTFIICEVQQLLGNHSVRAISMNATDGLKRGMKVLDTGAALSVPVGKGTLGRIFNVLGETVDNLGPVDASEKLPIHRPAPKFNNLDTKFSIFETGIKVVDLLAPYRRG